MAGTVAARRGREAGTVGSVDLNADVGEGAAAADVETALIGAVTSASVCCGAHAGSPEGIEAAVRRAVAAGVVVGAHPSYPDRPGFGRRRMDLGDDELASSLAAQIAFVARLAAEAGSAVRYVKPHGALYHDCAGDVRVARLVAAVVRDAGDMAVLLAAGPATGGVFERCGIRIVTEAFADRAYDPDGGLVARGRPGAVLEEPAAVVDQALSLVVDGRVRAGERWLEVRAESLCLHGDTPGAAGLARAVRDALAQAEVEVAPFVA
jgi:UPF0271 protein